MMGTFPIIAKNSFSSENRLQETAGGTERLNLSKEIIKYAEHFPNNLRWRDLVYFNFAPTLCFQIEYPRTKKFRPYFFFRRLGEFLLCMFALTFILKQYIEPIVKNSISNIKERSYSNMLERILKLSIPNVYAWLVMFYAIFHSFLNLVAEIIRFGDRKFYTDWWNAKSLGEYWRTWNLPVHNWFMRHMYTPLRRRGVDRTVAMLIVFLFSAFLHEYIIAFASGIYNFMAFFAMIGNVPIILFQGKFRKYLKDSQINNYIFWITFCFIGQPLSVLVYYYQYCDKHNLV